MPAGLVPRLLAEREGRRWADIVSFAINMEQVGDIIERILLDIEDKKIDKGRNFSEAGMAEGNPIAILEAGEKVLLPPTLWIQGQPDQTHDYRDPDSKYTRFQFDTDPADGWGAGTNGWSTQNIVWGLERPELVIAQTIASWDPDATVDRIELAVGRDLQFVRINGTLVGGVVGLAIYSIYRIWQ